MSGSGAPEKRPYEPWTEEEDRIVRKLVEECGTKKWIVIEELLKTRHGVKGRSSKQIRERWHNHLHPEVKKEKWTEDEERILFELHRQFGNRWATISAHMPGRSDNQIKNHYYSTLRRSMRILRPEAKRRASPSPRGSVGSLSAAPSGQPSPMAPDPNNLSGAGNHTGAARGSRQSRSSPMGANAVAGWGERGRRTSASLGSEAGGHWPGGDPGAVGGDRVGGDVNDGGGRGRGGVGSSTGHAVDGWTLAALGDEFPFNDPHDEGAKSVRMLSAIASFAHERIPAAPPTGAGRGGARGPLGAVGGGSRRQLYLRHPPIDKVLGALREIQRGGGPPPENNRGGGGGTGGAGGGVQGQGESGSSSSSSHSGAPPGGRGEGRQGDDAVGPPAHPQAPAAGASGSSSSSSSSASAVGGGPGVRGATQGASSASSSSSGPLRLGAGGPGGRVRLPPFQSVRVDIGKPRFLLHGEVANQLATEHILAPDPAASSEAAAVSASHKHLVLALLASAEYFRSGAELPTFHTDYFPTVLDKDWSAVVRELAMTPADLATGGMEDSASEDESLSPGRGVKREWKEVDELRSDPRFSRSWALIHDSAAATAASAKEVRRRESNEHPLHGLLSRQASEEMGVRVLSDLQPLEVPEQDETMEDIEVEGGASGAVSVSSLSRSRLAADGGVGAAAVLGGTAAAAAAALADEMDGERVSRVDETSEDGLDGLVSVGGRELRDLPSAAAVGGADANARAAGAGWHLSGLSLPPDLQEVLEKTVGPPGAAAASRRIRSRDDDESGLDEEMGGGHDHGGVSVPGASGDEGEESTKRRRGSSGGVGGAAGVRVVPIRRIHSPSAGVADSHDRDDDGPPHGDTSLLPSSALLSAYALGGAGSMNATPAGGPHPAPPFVPYRSVPLTLQSPAFGATASPNPGFLHTPYGFMRPVPTPGGPLNAPPHGHHLSAGGQGGQHGGPGQALPSGHRHTLLQSPGTFPVSASLGVGSPLTGPISASQPPYAGGGGDVDGDGDGEAAGRGGQRVSKGSTGKNPDGVGMSMFGGFNRSPAQGPFLTPSMHPDGLGGLNLHGLSGLMASMHEGAGGLGASPPSFAQGVGGIPSPLMTGTGGSGGMGGYGRGGFTLHRGERDASGDRGEGEGEGEESLLPPSALGDLPETAGAPPSSSSGRRTNGGGGLVGIRLDSGGLHGGGGRRETSGEASSSVSPREAVSHHSHSEAAGPGLGGGREGEGGLSSSLGRAWSVGSVGASAGGGGGGGAMSILSRVTQSSRTVQQGGESGMIGVKKKTGEKEKKPNSGEGNDDFR